MFFIIDYIPINLVSSSGFYLSTKIAQCLTIGNIKMFVM